MIIEMHDAHTTVQGTPGTKRMGCQCFFEERASSFVGGVECTIRYWVHTGTRYFTYDRVNFLIFLIRIQTTCPQEGGFV
jgi:hypothetical protein